MKHSRFSAIHNFKSFVFKPPAKIDFFHVRKKIFIQSALSMVGICSDKQAGSGCPEHFPGVIVLALVFFKAVKNSPPAKRVTELIKKTAGSSGIFKQGFVFVIQD